MTFDPSQMIGPSEAARRLGVSTDRVRQLDDALGAVRVAGRRLYPAARVDALAVERARARPARSK